MLKLLAMNEHGVFAILLLVQSATVLSGALNPCGVQENAKRFAILNIVCSCLLLIPFLVGFKKLKSNILLLLFLALSVWMSSAYYRLWKGKAPSNFLSLVDSGEKPVEGIILSIVALSVIVSVIIAAGFYFIRRDLLDEGDGR